MVGGREKEVEKSVKSVPNIRKLPSKCQKCQKCPDGELEEMAEWRWFGKGGEIQKG